MSRGKFVKIILIVIILTFVFAAAYFIFVRPTISQISPNSGPVGAVVTLYGSGFTLSDNAIFLSYPKYTGDVGSFGSSDGGRIIQFTVPSGLRGCFPGDEICTTEVIQVAPRGYKIIVKNKRGISNSVTFTVTAGKVETKDKNYSLSLCGVSVTVKTDRPVKTNTGNSDGLAWGQLTVGKPMPNSDLEISCNEKNKNPQSETEKLLNDVSYILSIQSLGSSKVNKNQYGVFQGQTLSNVTDLYSAKDRGYRVGSETIGFATNKWIYTFSFLDPKEAKNQDSFIISVNP